MVKPKLRAFNVLDNGFSEAIIVAPSMGASRLKSIFKDYRLLLIIGNEETSHYKLKKGKETVGTIFTYSPKVYLDATTDIHVNKKHKKELFESLEIEVISTGCPKCNAHGEPVAKRASASYGRAPYSAELSYNCPECGYQFWPPLERRMKPQG